MAAEIYRAGDRVDGLYDENTDDMWYPGRIRCVHLSEDNDSADGPTCEVLYDDGEVEMHVRPEFLRQHVPGTICVGTRVLCRYDGGEEFYPGQVSDVQENGVYTIAYDDGEVEEDVPLLHIMEPKEDEREDAEAAEEEEKQYPNETMDDVATEEAQQQEDIEMEDVQGSPVNSVDDAGSAANMQQKSEEDMNGENFDEPEQPRAEEFNYDESPQHAGQKEDLQPSPGGVSAERAYIIESLQLLEKRLGDAASTKSVLSTLVKQMRAYPQITADLVHERDGERVIIDSLKFHQAHAVIQCYGFVLLRRLCFLCVKSTHYLLRNGIVELVIQAMNVFAEDAILQASACGALAVFTRVRAGLNSLIEYQVAQLVLSTLIYHKTYSVHTRQVHYYACEVLLELCELDDLQTLNLLCGEQEEDFTGDMSPISLLLFLLRQGLSLDDKKACCAVGSLLMCLAANGRRAAALILSLNGLAELSTVMARYPTEPSIQKYLSAASKQIALCSVRQSPTKRIKDTATEILRETESLESTPRGRQPTKRSAPRGRSTSIGKRKSNPTLGYGSPAYPCGVTHTSGTPYRNDQGFSKASSPFGQGTSGFSGETNSFGYSARDYPVSSTAPQQPSSLVILDGSLGMDSGFGSTNKRKQISKEDRQSELFDAYGIQGISNSANGRPYGTKRAQLKAHLASAESTWAAPQQHEIFQGSSASKPYSNRSEHLDHDPAYSHRDFVSSRQNRWEYENDEPQNPGYDPDMRQNRGAKRKKKTPVTRTLFQVRIENENQLRVSRDTQSPYPSPQRLGAATKRAAKARQKRITGGAYSSLIGRSNNASSESLNDYATQLFQENATRTGTGIPTGSKLTPREKEEIRERERLSFAEKLHKMIDKAKSTLANSNTASVDDAVRPQKYAASSKVVRKTRELSTDEKRPLSKKTRAAVSSTPKNVSKEVSSPREAKPTSGLPKRQIASNDAGAQQPVFPRAKPIVSRSVMTPKRTTDSKPRTAVKSSRAITPKLVDKHDAEKDKVVAETAPAEVASASAIAIEDAHDVEPVAVVSESVVLPVQSTEELITPSETISTEEVEPTSEIVQVEAGAVSVDVGATPESEAKADIAGPGNEHGDVVPHNRENAGQVDDKDAGEEEEEAAVMSAPAEGEVVAHSEDVTPSIVQDRAPENGMIPTAEAVTKLSDPSVDAVQPSVPLLKELSGALESGDDQPSGASAIADAMYGDDYSEFDDNGGDDEDMTVEAGADTDDAHTSTMGTSELATDVPLQESKSGEALYDDGYNEFDDDEATEEADAEVAPAAEAVDSQGTEASAVISSQTTDEVSDPAADASETEAEHLVEQGDSPPVPAVERTLSIPVEEEKERLEHDINVDEQSAIAGVEAHESDYVGNEPEESQEQQAVVADDDNASRVDTNQNDLDPLETNAEGELDEGTATTVDNNSVVEVNEPEDGAHVDPANSAVGENAGGATTLDNEADVPGGEKADDAYEQETAPETEIDVAAPTIEPTETEGAVEVSDPGIQPIDLDEVQHTDTPGEAVDCNDKEDSPSDVKETNTEREKPLDTSDSSPLLGQYNEDSKKLTPDSSDASIQSAAYDEENFDDMESHQDVEPTDAIESPVVSRVEETVEVVDQQPPEADISEIAEAPVAASTSNGVEEEEPKGLVANSSELSVQSAAYDDDDFDDGAQEEAPHEKNADNTEIDDQEHGEQRPSAVEGTGDTETNLQSDPVAQVDEASDGVEEEEKAQGAVVDSEVPSAVAGSNENEGFNGTIRDDAPTEVATESMVAEATQESPEQQQLEHSNSTSNTESGPASAASSVIAESEAMKKEESDNDLQVNDAADIFPENDNSSAASATEDSVEPSATTESSNDPSAESKAPESEAPEITISTDDVPAQEETLENSIASGQLVTYEDDALDNDGENEQTTTSVMLDSSPLEEECSDEGSQNGEPDTKTSSKQTSDKAEDSALEGVTNADDPVATSKALSEPESPATDQSKQLTDESTPSPTDGANVSAMVDTTNDSVSDVAIEPELAVNLVDDAVDQIESLSTPDDADAGSSVNEGTGPGSEEALSRPELQLSTPDKQPEDLGESTPPDENASPEPDSVSASQSTDSVELDGAEVAVAASLDEGEVNVVGITQDTAAAEVRDYTQCDDSFDEHPPESDPDNSAELSDPTLADVSVPAETSAEPSTDLTSEETQYEDAESDDVENDEVSENEISPAYNSTAGELPSAKIDQAEEKGAEVNDDTEATKDQDTKEEATSPATEMQEKKGTPELPEAVVDTNGNAGVVMDEHTTGDATIETGGTVDHTSDSADQDASTMAEAGVQDAVSPDVTAYDEDFPSDVSPEAHEVAAVGATASLGEEEILSNGYTVVEPESPAVAENNPDVSTDDLTQVSGGSDTAPVSPSQEEQYDDGFEDEKTPSALNDADISTIDATPPTEMDTVGSTNDDVPENSVVAETPNGSAASESEQLNEDRTGGEEVGPITADSGVKEENGGTAEKSDISDSVHAGPAITTAEPEVVESDIVGFGAVKTGEVEPAAAESEITASEAITKATTDIPRDKPEVPEQVSIPEASEELAIEVDPPQPDEVAVGDDATPAAASEETKTEDQYDDDDGYNDFDDQDNGSPVPAAEPTIEAPAPSATAMEAPATEDEYEDYENEDYDEDEKPVDVPIPEPVVQPSSSPPTSARGEEIEEVTDEPEQAEDEAYADDQDEYEEDEAPAPAFKSDSSTKDASTPRAEASADEYEDDNEEEEYAEDEIEEASPRPTTKTAPHPAANKSDEMEDEVGYDSEYAESDG